MTLQYAPYGADQLTELLPGDVAATPEVWVWLAKCKKAKSVELQIRDGVIEGNLVPHDQYMFEEVNVTPSGVQWLRALTLDNLL